jgi:hypothetical protein
MSEHLRNVGRRSLLCLAHFNEAGARPQQRLNLGPSSLKALDQDSAEQIARSHPKHLRSICDPNCHRGEVFVLCYDDCTLSERPRPDVGVVRIPEPDLPESRCLVPLVAKPGGALGQKLCVNNEPHRLFGGDDDGMAKLGHGVGEAGADVVPLEVGKVRQNFIFRRPAGQHFEDINHANPHPPNAGPAVALLRPNGYAGEKML